MEKNYILTKWLNNELTAVELAEFKNHPDFDKYEKIKKYSAQLKVDDFDEAAVLKTVISHKKTTPKRIPLYKNWGFKVAAVLVITLGIAFTFQNFSVETQFASNGKRTSFLLPDHSEVVLNAGSEINYKKLNWNNHRNLKLEGEAYFKVAKGERFEVETNLGNVAVLGTQFNVKTRENRFSVTCFEGRVKVNYKDKEIILTHGQSVIFENGNQTNSSTDNTKPDWFQNKITFNKENLHTILNEIQRQYNIEIDVKPKYPESLFSGKIPTDNLEVALQIIATTYDLELKRISANKIIFEGK